MNTQTKQRHEESKAVAIQPVARLAPSRLPITNEVAARLGVTSEQWRVLVEQTFPAARSVEAVQMAIAYCRHRNLDVYKKPVHIVPVYSSALKRMVETVWPGISELRTTAARTKQYAGLTEAEFGPIVKREFVQTFEREDRTKGEVRHAVEYPEWCRMTAYRMLDGTKCAFTARIFWIENYATAGRFTDAPNEMWRKRPHGQLEKCCEAAVLRKAFPEELGNEYAAEEMQGRVLDDDNVAVAQIPDQQRPEPPRPPRPAQQKSQAPTGGGGGAQSQRGASGRGGMEEVHGSDGRSADRTNDADHQTMDEDDRSSSRQAASETKAEDSNVVDAEIEDDFFPGDVQTSNDEQQPDDDDNSDSDYFYRLEAALAECVDEGHFNEVWDEFDCMAKFDGDETSQDVCVAIKKRQMKRLYGDG